MRDTSALGFLVCFRLGLGRCGHEGDQRVPHGLLHRVLSRAVERQVIDDSADHNSAPHELPNRRADILVVSTQAVDPAHNQDVTAAQHVE